MQGKSKHFALSMMFMSTQTGLASCRLYSQGGESRCPVTSAGSRGTTGYSAGRETSVLELALDSDSLDLQVLVSVPILNLDIELRLE